MIFSTAQKEFWRQFAGSILRQLLGIVGTYFAGRGWITVVQADGLTTAATVEIVLSILLIFGATLWSAAKNKFNVAVVREARASSAATPIGVITTETLDKSTATLISSV